MWKVGLVGTGYWSVHHLNAWKQIEGVQVTALCNRSREKLERRAKEFDIPDSALYASLEEMCAREDIDIVDIVTGPETHLAFVETAAKAGKHIMCQKPFAATLDVAKAMVRIAEERGVRLMVTENWRWLQPNQIIKKAIDDGLLGRLYNARYVHTDYYTPRMAPGVELPQPFFREMPRLLFYEMGAHWFDTVRFLFGEPKRLYAELQRVSPHIAGEDSGVVTLGYDDNFFAVLDMSWATRRELEGKPPEQVGPMHREQMTIEGEKGTIKLYMNGRVSFIDAAGVESTLEAHTELDHAESHCRLQGHFIDCLNRGAPFQTSGEDNLKTLELIFATYESAATHDVIRFPRSGS